MQNYCVSIAAEKELRLSMEGGATETHVPADRSRLTQVLWNLLQNACKFTPAGGTILVRLFNEESPENGRPDLVVQISDNGIGISAETIPLIFKPFEQGERARSRVFGGLGLGLAISRAIVDAHGGSITATSKGKNEGTTVTVRLPTVPAPRVADQVKPSAGGAETPAARPLRVLLVEDHPDTAQQLTRLLRRAGHEVICVGGVKEALGQGRNGNFDVLISDLGLPDGNGYDLMRNLTQAHPIPGIALSGFGMKDDVQNSIAAGFACHFTKPVDWQKLKTEIQRIAVRSNN
jgi:CheY-like chemotaxis protein